MTLSQPSSAEKTIRKIDIAQVRMKIPCVYPKPPGTASFALAPALDVSYNDV
jgi:hypothetical protein